MYFSELEIGEELRDREQIDANFWQAFVGLFDTYMNRHFLAESFPDNCNVYDLPTRCNIEAMSALFHAEIRGISYPFDPLIVPDTLNILDAIQFFSRYVSKPTEKAHHDYQKHDHLRAFDKEAGFTEYRNDINRLFRRCKHPYELGHDLAGSIKRLVPPVLREILPTHFQTNDSELNRMLTIAVEKFQSPDLSIREESLKDLWDAWERLKSQYANKQNEKEDSIKQLLNKAVPEPNLRDRVDQEAKELTKIGNSFMIRHSETYGTKIVQAEHIDYLFHRLFALIWMLTKFL